MMKTIVVIVICAFLAGCQVLLDFTPLPEATGLAGPEEVSAAEDLGPTPCVEHSVEHTVQPVDFCILIDMSESMLLPVRVTEGECAGLSRWQCVLRALEGGLLDALAESSPDGKVCLALFTTQPPGHSAGYGTLRINGATPSEWKRLTPSEALSIAHSEGAGGDDSFNHTPIHAILDKFRLHKFLVLITDGFAQWDALRPERGVLDVSEEMARIAEFVSSPLFRAHLSVVGIGPAENGYEDIGQEVLAVNNEIAQLGEKLLELYWGKRSCAMAIEIPQDIQPLVTVRMNGHEVTGYRITEAGIQLDDELCSMYRSMAEVEVEVEVTCQALIE